jgi:hypothetical protein
MTQVNINGELFDVFIVRGQDADPVPILMDVAPRTLTATASVASATSSTTIVAVNANRKGISIYNNSTAALFLSYANPATAANSFMQMQPGSLLILDQQLIVSNAIYGIWTAANGTAQVTQYT